MPRLYLYAALGVLAQIEFPETKGERPVMDGDKPVTVGDPPKPLMEPAPFPRASEEPGALYLRPGSTVHLTAEELAHIKAERPDVARHLQGPLDAEPKAKDETAAPQQPAGSGSPDGNKSDENNADSGDPEAPKPGAKSSRK